MGKSTRKLQKEQTRALLVETAYRVFSEKGIMNTRISDIAQAAGVSHGTVFVHFRTQEELIGEVVSAYGERIAMRTHELAEMSGDLEGLLRAHLNGIMEFEPFYTRLVIECRMLPAAARDSWVAIQSAISFHFSQVAGSAGHGVPAYLLFNMWVGLVHYYLANGDLFAPQGNVISRYRDLLVLNFMRLLRGAGEGDGNG